MHKHIIASTVEPCLEVQVLVNWPKVLVHRPHIYSNTRASASGVLSIGTSHPFTTFIPFPDGNTKFNNLIFVQGCEAAKLEKKIQSTLSHTRLI